MSEKTNKNASKTPASWFDPSQSHQYTTPKSIDFGVSFFPVDFPT